MDGVVSDPDLGARCARIYRYLTIAYGQRTGTMNVTVEDFTEAAIPEASVALTHAAER